MLVLAGAYSFGEIAFAIMLVLTACGCFLVGINLMSRGFVQATLKSESFFTRGFNSKTRFGGVGFGFIHSAIAQSSDVTAVTVVRLADLGTITLFQACACIIGANIGTTITTFIASLQAYEKLIPIFSFLAFIGAIPLLSKKKPLKIFGEVVAGFGILFIGLNLLHQYTNDDSFKYIIGLLFGFTEMPILLMAIGVGLTMIVQSSSVVTCMVVFLVGSGQISLASALCLVAGANIGTCITSWIAALGSSRTSRRTAMFHTLFNLVGAAVFSAVIYIPAIRNPFLGWANSILVDEPEIKVALFHLAFNLSAALVMIPLLRPCVWVCKKIVRH